MNDIERLARKLCTLAGTEWYPYDPDMMVWVREMPVISTPHGKRPCLGGYALEYYTQPLWMDYVDRARELIDSGLVKPDAY